MKQSVKNTIKWGGAVVAAPFILVILLMVLLYIPPVQNWAVHTVADYASEKTGMQISVERVHLQFPLDLGIDNFKMIKQNDSLPQVKDTVADMGKLVVRVKLLPLFSRQVEIDQLDLQQVKLNTSDFVHEARVKGTVGRLSLESHGIDWGRQTVKIDDAKLKDANVNVELSDTVPPDTSKTPTYWKINVEKLRVENTKAVVHMPGDTLQVEAYLGKAGVRGGDFDLYKNAYKAANTRKPPTVMIANREIFVSPISASIRCSIGNANARCTPAMSSGAVKTVKICELMLRLISFFVMPTFCRISNRPASS